jgi:aryl-alcohol dehydrogenase-like predicted oxidoreductase
VLVYGPLAHGLLSGKYTANVVFPSDDWRSKTPMFQGDGLRRNLEVVHRLRAFAESRELRIGQLAIAWTLANPAVDVAIAGARRPDQIAQTAPAAEIHLTPADLEEIKQLMRDAVAAGGPSPEGM